MNSKILFSLIFISNLYSNEINQINKPLVNDNTSFNDNNISNLELYHDPFGIYGGIDNYKGEEVLLEEHHNNGRVSKSEIYINGIKNGESKGYYWNGSLYWTKTYVNGKVDGIVKTFYKNGDLKGVFEYRKGIFYKTIKKYKMKPKKILEDDTSK